MVEASGYYRTAAIAALAALLATGLAAWFLTQRTGRTVQLARSLARHVPLLNADSAESFLRMMAQQVGMLGRDPRRLGIDVLFAALNWLLDAAALWVLLAALGHPLGPGPLLTLYSVGNILATLPLTPGGLGIVEGVMAPALVGLASLPPLQSWQSSAGGCSSSGCHSPLVPRPMHHFDLGPFRRRLVSSPWGWAQQ
ncbi:flippase-like domain-containing protein [Arthrobacter stackebrandtii]|uniref:flippase-like domain-containing protein n=1 Tax=Arthrobacter stackebrandtii TaxID=272161 RepID=UPI003CCA0CCD